MRVIVLRNPPRKLKGMVSRVSTEVSTNVFVTTISSKEADSLWWDLQGSDAMDFGCVMAEPSTVEPGFSIRCFGSLQGRTAVIDGIPVKSRPSKSLKTRKQN